MAIVNLDALIRREDFEVEGNGEPLPDKTSILLADLHTDSLFYAGLRKPDFQRESAEWDPGRVAGLIRSFISGDFIPSVCLWANGDLYFAIDGAHRLSALLAWVHNDYGDGPISQRFFGYEIPPDQAKSARRTREMVETEFGSYASHRLVATEPTEAHPSEVRSRAFALAAKRALRVQWIGGDSSVAEHSFYRINEKAVVIQGRELDFLKKRGRPEVVAARAIIRKGTGHKYWSRFQSPARDEIEALAAKVYSLLFAPQLRYPIKTLELPPGGSVSAGTVLAMTHDLILLTSGGEANEDDQTGERTVECLKRCHRAMKLLVDKDSSSVGLHPALYFYSWAGKQLPMVLLIWMELILEYRAQGRLADFTEARAAVEAFLLGHKNLVGQIVRKYGAKSSGKKHLRTFYGLLLEQTRAKADEATIVRELQHSFPFLSTQETIAGALKPKRPSTKAKSGFVMGQLLDKAPRCEICNGLVPPQAISLDHNVRLQDGGDGTTANIQFSHPYCNTGYKEALAAAKRKK